MDSITGILRTLWDMPVLGPFFSRGCKQTATCIQQSGWVCASCWRGHTSQKQLAQKSVAFISRAKRQGAREACTGPRQKFKKNKRKKRFRKLLHTCSRPEYSTTLRVNPRGRASAASANDEAWIRSTALSRPLVCKNAHFFLFFSFGLWSRSLFTRSCNIAVGLERGPLATTLSAGSRCQARRAQASGGRRLPAGGGGHRQPKEPNHVSFCAVEKSTRSEDTTAEILVGALFFGQNGFANDGEAFQLRGYCSYPASFCSCNRFRYTPTIGYGIDRSYRGHGT